MAQHQRHVDAGRGAAAGRRRRRHRGQRVLGGRVRVELQLGRLHRQRERDAGRAEDEVLGERFLQARGQQRLRLLLRETAEVHAAGLDALGDRRLRRGLGLRLRVLCGGRHHRSEGAEDRDAGQAHASRVASALRNGATRPPREAAARPPAARAAKNSSTRRQVVRSAERPVRTPRWPPGQVSSSTSGALGSRSGDVMHRVLGRERVGRAGDAQHRHAHVREVDLVVAEVEPAVGEVVDAEELVVELAHRPPRIGVHVRDEVVDRLDLRQEVAVVEVRQHGQRLRQVLVDRAQLEPAAHQRSGRAAEQPVQRRAEHAVGDVRDPADRRHDAHMGEVERARHHRDRLDRQGLVGGEREQRHDPAQAPAEHLHARAAVVLADPPDRVGEDVVDPVLEPKVAVGERDVPVLERGRSGGPPAACARPANSRGAGRSTPTARRAAAPAAAAARGGAGRRRAAGSGRRCAWAPRR